MLRVLTARSVLAASDLWFEGGGLVLRGERVERLLHSPAEVQRAARDAGVQVEDLGEGTLTPGLVNAHAHLELGGLAGRLPRQGPFSDWVRALLVERAGWGMQDYVDGVRRGARRCLETGTTTVGDIDSSGSSESLLGEQELRVRLFREVLDVHDPERLSIALATLERPFDGAGLAEPGISPHAPYTVSRALFQAVAAHTPAVPVSIHWAESESERDWYRAGEGGFEGLLPRLEASLGSGLEPIEAAGLLEARTSLVHANHPLDSERRRVARAGSVVVHCAGTHAFFERGAFDFEAWFADSVPIALGTDSMASNEDLDMRREMALVRRAAPGLAPSQVWDMATVHGARALGWEGRIGRLLPGFEADLCLFESGERGHESQLEALTACRTPLRAVWVAGRRRKLPENEA